MRISPIAAFASLVLAGAAVAQPAKPVTPASPSAKVDSTKAAHAKAAGTTHKGRRAHAKTKAQRDSAAAAKKGTKG